MLPRNWSVLSPLIDAVLDSPASDRDERIRELTLGNPEMHAELERLVRECVRDAPLMNRPAAEQFASLFDDDEEPPPAILGETYRIVRELGRGATARVYLADDLRHSRQVAVKVLRPELAAIIGRERFLSEIRIAARLRHPNIVPMYDSDDADGVLYFVMPFEDGMSLREWLITGASMSTADRIAVLRDIARALVCAHDNGVVHRDIKPDNVMLTGGAAVVADFGIAQALTIADREMPAAAGLGTPAYMAPEQARGDRLADHRADLYSFGCVAYELFAGHPPFHDRTSREMTDAHAFEAIVPLGEIAAGVPRQVAALVERCLAKNPDDRPQSARHVLTLLESPLVGHPTRWPRRATRAIIAGLLAAAALSTYIGVAASRRRIVRPDAYRLVLVAQRALSRRGLRVRESAELFRQAIAQDTLYAEAYAGLSLAVALSPYFESIPAAAVAAPANEAATHALRLDPSLAQPHVALALVHQFAYEWDSAGREFEMAIARDPRDVEARVQYGRHLLFRDHAADALTQLRVARREDPASALVLSWMSYAYYVQGQLDSAIVESARAFQSDSNNTTTLAFGALVELRAGHLERARDLMSRNLPTNETTLYVLAAVGDSAAAMARVRALERAPHPGSRVLTDRAYVMLGARDTASALTSLEQAIAAGEIWPSLESTLDPIFDPIRATPRFRRLVERLHLR